MCHVHILKFAAIVWLYFCRQSVLFYIGKIFDVQLAKWIQHCPLQFVIIASSECQIEIIYCLLCVGAAGIIFSCVCPCVSVC